MVSAGVAVAAGSGGPAGGGGGRGGGCGLPASTGRETRSCPRFTLRGGPEPCTSSGMRPRTSRTESVACEASRRGCGARRSRRSWAASRGSRSETASARAAPCAPPCRPARSSSPPRAQVQSRRHRPRRGRRERRARPPQGPPARSAAFHRLHRRRPGAQNPCQREVFAVSSRISMFAPRAGAALGPQASAGARLRRVLHGDPGRGDRERRAAVDPGGPRISRDTLQWIVTAYSLGGSSPRRPLRGSPRPAQGVHVRMVLFTAATRLRARRQRDATDHLPGDPGLGGAIVSPATLAIISDSFRHDQAERNKAFGIWGGVAGSGAAAGVLLGGILVEYLGWEWIFFVNVPVGVAIFALAPTLISEGRIEDADRRVDVLGAALVTSGLVLFVYAMSEAPDAVGRVPRRSGPRRSRSRSRRLLLVGGPHADADRAAQALPDPPGLSRTPSALLGATIFGGFFLLTLYMQTVLGYSPLEAGSPWLAARGDDPRRSDRASRHHAHGREARDDGRNRVPGLRLPLVHAAAGRRDVLEELFVPFVLSGFGLFIFIPMSLAALSALRIGSLVSPRACSTPRSSSGCGRCRADLDDLERASGHAGGGRRGPAVRADRRLQLGLRGRLGLRAARRRRRLGRPRGRTTFRPRAQQASPADYASAASRLQPASERPRRRRPRGSPRAPPSGALVEAQAASRGGPRTAGGRTARGRPRRASAGRRPRRRTTAQTACAVVPFSTIARACRTKKVGWPWLSRSLVSGSARQSSRMRSRTSS